MAGAVVGAGQPRLTALTRKRAPPQLVPVGQYRRVGFGNNPAVAVEVPGAPELDLQATTQSSSQSAGTGGGLHSLSMIWQETAVVPSVQRMLPDGVCIATLPRAL